MAFIVRYIKHKTCKVSYIFCIKRYKIVNIKHIISWASKAILSETSKVLQESGMVDMHLRFSGRKSKELQGRGTFKCWQLNSSWFKGSNIYRIKDLTLEEIHWNRKMVLGPDVIHR